MPQPITRFSVAPLWQVTQHLAAVAGGRAAADLVITKGQGNFETLNEYDRPIFFLFRAKCAIIVKFLGNVPMGSMQVVAANIN